MEDKKIYVDKHVTKVMESEWGFDALHIGQFPQDWVRPGGFGMDYRNTSKNMLTTEQVLATKELKNFKCLREDDLYRRRVNATNHIETHNCSNYCKKVRKYCEIFDINKHIIMVPTMISKDF